MFGIIRTRYPVEGLWFSWWIYSGFKSLTLLISVLTFGLLLVTWADDWFENRVEACRRNEAIRNCTSQVRNYLRRSDARYH